MVIEWLQFRVLPTERDRFVQQDALIWTATLSQQPGFLRKECWAVLGTEDQLVIVVYWHSQAQWEQISPALLAATEHAFRTAMGDCYELLATHAYQPLLSTGTHSF